MLLLLGVLAIRFALPTGFMPDRTAKGMVISVCTGHGTAELFLPTGPKGQEKGSDGKADMLCSFAAGLGSGLLQVADPAMVHLAAASVGMVSNRAIADLTVHRLAAPPPPSQAPPVRA